MMVRRAPEKSGGHLPILDQVQFVFTIMFHYLFPNSLLGRTINTKLETENAPSKELVHAATSRFPVPVGNSVQGEISSNARK